MQMIPFYPPHQPTKSSPLHQKKGRKSAAQKQEWQVFLSFMFPPFRNTPKQKNTKIRKTTLPWNCVQTRVGTEKELTKTSHRKTRTREVRIGPSSGEQNKNKNPISIHANNRIMSYPTLRTGISENIFCNQCVEQNQKKLLNQFGVFLFSKLNVDALPRMDQMVRLFMNEWTTKNALTSTGKIEVKEHTIGIATSVEWKCKQHKSLFTTHRTKTNFLHDKKKRIWKEDYLLNVLLVLSIQSFGGGGTEVDRILSFLGLPHAPSFGATGFHHIENSLGPLIKGITQKEMDDALEEEIRCQMKEDNIEDIEDRIGQWKRREIRPSIQISYDMGWKKRSSGHR